MTHAPYTLQAPTGGREVLSWASSQGNIARLLASWETDTREPFELELLCYPSFHGEAGVGAVNFLSTFGNIFLDLTASLGGGGGGASAAVFSTTDNLYGTNLTLPSNGLRLRFTARAAALRITQVKNPQQCAILTAFTPVNGGGVTAPIPSRVTLSYDETFPESHPSDESPTGVVIPKGAREVRAISSNPLAWFAFKDPRGTPRQLASAAQLYDWRPFTGHAFFVSVAQSSGAAADWDPAQGERFELEFR